MSRLKSAWRTVLLGTDADHQQLAKPTLRDGGHRRGRPRLPCREATNKPYAGATLAYAWEDGAGGPLPDARIAQDNTCECCRISVSFAGPGKPAVLFRNIFTGGVRDHAVITFSDPSTPQTLHRVSDDDAVLDACPHQGPSLSIGPDGTYHATGSPSARSGRGFTTRARSMVARRSRPRCRSATPRTKIHVPMSWPSTMRSRSPTRRSMANGRPSRS